MAGMPDAAADPGGAVSTPAPPPASNGVDHGAERTYTVTDTRSAGDAIAGLLYGADDDKPAPPRDRGERAEQPSGGEEPPDTGADEPTGDEGEDTREQPATAAIAAPASWTRDEQEAFTKLPPALQQTISRRESQREAVLTQRSQEAAEARRSYDGERQAAVALRQEYLQGLQKMLTLAVPEAQAFSNVDWVALAQQNPAESVRLQAMREDLRNRLGAIEGQFQQQQAQLSQYQQQQLGEVVAKEHQALNEKMPDYGDQVKGAQLRKDLSTYLAERGGFTPQEISTAYDHRMVVIATKAMLYDRQISAAASADTKRNNVAPQVRAPGTSQDNDRGPRGRLQSRINRLGRTNSVRDAGSLIAEIL
jgi:hypothetical protein